MPQTLAELLPNPTKEDVLAALLKAAQGVGYTSHTGFSTGTVTVNGASATETSLRIRVSTAGSLGGAEVEISSDGGTTYESPVVVPIDGLLDVVDLDIQLVFTEPETTSADPFLEGDIFSIELNASTLAALAWQPGSVPLTLLELDAQAMEDVHTLIGEFISGGFLEYSTGPWLTLLSRNVYGLTRVSGRATRGEILLTDVTGDGPHVLTDGQLTFTDNNGLRFTSSGAATLPASGTLSLPVYAEEVGADYNVGNATITTFVTPLPGVTCSNVDLGEGTWITTTGRDEESDEDLRIRCRERWPEMGVGATASGYDLWARTAEDAVTRTLVRASPTVPGEVEVYLAGDAGGVSGPEVTTVDTYIQQRVPLTCTAVVASATEYNYTVLATVYVEAAYAAAAQVEALANLNAYDQSIPIAGTIYRSKIFSALDSPEGVRNVVLTTPAADITLGALEVGNITISLTFTEV